MALYTARVLAGLETALGAPLHTRFDLVAGTSAGGILAAAVAAGVPMVQFADAFAEAGPYIFSRNTPTKTKTAALRDLLWYAMNAKYDSKPLDEVIAQFLPDTYLIGDLATRLILPTTNLTLSSPQTLRTHHLNGHEHASTWTVRNACLATTAAPLFFPLHEVHGQYFADGGLYANTPDMLALHEATGLMHIPDTSLAMLSIGTIAQPPSVENLLHRSWGLRQWTKEQFIIKTVMHAQERTAIRLVRQRLHSRYLRVDGKHSNESLHTLGLDVATPEAREMLDGLAQDTLHTLLNDQRLTPFFMHQAPVTTFGPSDGSQ